VKAICPSRLVVLLLLLAGAITARAADRQALHGHVPAAVVRLQPVDRLPRTSRLDLTIGLPLRNRETLTNLLKDLYDPSGPRYHKYLTAGQFADQFGPTEAEYSSVITFAKSNHLAVTGLHPNRTLLEVNGSVADIERAFHVHLRVYRHPTEPRTFYAPDTEPWLDLATPVLRIEGLDNFTLPRPMDLGPAGFRPMSRSAPNDTPLAAGSGPRGSFIGRDFRAAYVPEHASDFPGAGQTLGLLELDGYYADDIRSYEDLAGLPYVPLTNVVPAKPGSPGLVPGGNNIEVALDIEMAVSMAPGLSNIIVYEGSSGLNVLNRMANDNLAKQLSSSWSFGADVDTNRDQIFQQFEAQGQTMFQASGDGGAYSGGVSSLSDNPYLTVVGGTSLTTGPNGVWVSETTWSGSGGGVSMNYPIPYWQQGVSMAANQGSTTMRNIPDVACQAAPVIWVIVNNGQEGAIGGTSAAAPLWAGFTALANQQGAVFGLSSVGFLNPALYAIGQSGSYGYSLHDITTGNDTNAGSPTKFYATNGYDLCTGWGTPADNSLALFLLFPPSVPPALKIVPEYTPLPVSPNLASSAKLIVYIGLTYTGPVGGPFAAVGSISPDLGLLDTTTSNLSWAAGRSADWFKASPPGGTLVPGVQSNVTVAPDSAANNLAQGVYSATLWFTNLNDQSVQTAFVELLVSGLPQITTQPVSQVVIQGQSATFQVDTATNGEQSFQWQFDNGSFVTNLSDQFPDIIGSQSSTLTINNVSPADAGAYSVVITNTSGSVTSSPAYLAIVPWRPTITTQPTGTNVFPGQSVPITVGVAGTQPLVFQWQRNGTNITDSGDISGSTTATLTFNSILPTDAGTYSVVISNSIGSATSAGALISVVTNTTPGAGLATLYSFTGGNDGGEPNGLIQGADGSLYGTTVEGGTNFAGTVFKMTPSGLLTTLYQFTGDDDGASPFATLTSGSNGLFYGTTFQGGSNDNGTVFSISTNGVLDTLVQFNETNGDLPYAGLITGADGSFYGVTYQGGNIGFGSTYRMDTNGNLTTLYSFSGGADGGLLYAGIAQAADGNLYGAAFQGGGSGLGCIFRAGTNGTSTNILTFNNANGAAAYGGLMLGSDSNLYGTTFLGGATSNGTIFKITTAGALATLHSFTGTNDGGNPSAGLMLSSDGNYYGSTTFGGTYGDGTVFRLTPGGSLATLGSFDGFDGANPRTALAQGSDGNLYGTTSRGGASGQGVVFRLSATGSPQFTLQPASQSVYVGDTVLLSAAAFGAPLLSFRWLDNGTNLQDGAGISGSATRILTLSNVSLASAGPYSMVVSNAFGSITSTVAMLQVTSSPPVILVQPTNQTVPPGATVVLSAGVGGNAPLSYQWEQNGIPLADRGNISGSATGTLTLANVVETNDGLYSMFVTNALGSTISSNALLSIVPPSASGTLMTTLHAFSGGSDGANPNALVVGSDGNIYGTTEFDAPGQGFGKVFSITPGGAMTTLTTFTGLDGALPLSGMTQGTDGNFYGTTQLGGVDSAGNAYRMTPDGTLTNLYTFTDGQDPATVLVQGTNGNFYGMMSNGGAFGSGYVFEMTPDGLFTNIYSFANGADGGYPNGGLEPGRNGSFYGLTAGGKAGFGTIFKISPAGQLAPLYSFTGGSDGSSPAGVLVQGTDGNFYGTTTHNTLSGFQFYGTIFKVTPSGGLSTLYMLNSGDGSYPRAGLIQGTDGNFYGTTYQGGATGAGAVFRVTPAGAYTTLLSFDGFDDGANPVTPLVQGLDGSLYGTTGTGGPGGRGTVFRLSLTGAPQITTQPGPHTTYAGSAFSFSVAVSGASPLFYQWLRGSSNLADSGNVSGSATRVLTITDTSSTNAGTYSVTISNTLGSVTSTGATLTVLPLAQPAFTSVTQKNTTVIVLKWSAVSGLTYQLQSSSDLQNWTDLHNPITASSSTVSTTDAMLPGSSRYYRVVLVP
jgi:uncharacterized repeat protein (TIGR03803 family)